MIQKPDKYSAKTFTYLCEDAKQIRTKVFVEEQKFEVEFDEIDDTAKHMVLYCDKTPIACSRYFPSEEEGEYIVGRLAVMKDYRGLHLGDKMLTETEEQIVKDGGSAVKLHAQLQAQAFYETCGYEAYGEVEYEEYCPHTWMKKVLVQEQE